MSEDRSPHSAESRHSRLLSVTEAAALVAVSGTTVRTWINAGSIPYVELPATGERSRFRIPLQGFLASLAGNHDLAADLANLTVERCPANAAGHCPHWLDSGEACHYCGGEPS